MTDSAALKLVPPGTLPASGPVGRLLPAALGIACLYAAGVQIMD